jgi:hypothetical protein
MVDRNSDPDYNYYLAFGWFARLMPKREPFPDHQLAIKLPPFANKARAKSHQPRAVDVGTIAQVNADFRDV